MPNLFSNLVEKSISLTAPPPPPSGSAADFWLKNSAKPSDPPRSTDAGSGWGELVSGPTEAEAKAARTNFEKAAKLLHTNSPVAQASWVINQSDWMNKAYPNSWVLDAYDASKQAMQAFLDKAPNPALFDTAIDKWDRVLAGTSLDLDVRLTGEVFLRATKDVRPVAMTLLANLAQLKPPPKIPHLLKPPSQLFTDETLDKLAKAGTAEERKLPAWAVPVGIAAGVALLAFVVYKSTRE